MQYCNALLLKVTFPQHCLRYVAVCQMWENEMNLMLCTQNWTLYYWRGGYRCHRPLGARVRSASVDTDTGRMVTLREEPEDEADRRCIPSSPVSPGEAYIPASADRQRTGFWDWTSSLKNNSAAAHQHGMPTRWSAPYEFLTSLTNQIHLVNLLHQRGFIRLCWFTWPAINQLAPAHLYSRVDCALLVKLTKTRTKIKLIF